MIERDEEGWIEMKRIGRQKGVEVERGGVDPCIRDVSQMHLQNLMFPTSFHFSLTSLSLDHLCKKFPSVA
jgi:hypothetical protein